MADDQGLAEARLALDRERHALDMELRREELALKRTVEHRRGWRDPLILAILAATIGLIGNGVITLINARTQRQIEDQKDEAARILQSLSIADREQVKENLRFLVDAGLVSYAAPRILAYLQQQGIGEGPSIAAPTQQTGVQALVAVTEDDATPDASDVRKYFGPVCAMAASGAFTNCGYQTLDACQTQLATTQQGRAKQTCIAKPAKAFCFAATSGSGLSLKNCTDTVEHCDALRTGYRHMSRQLASLGKTCTPIDL